MIKILTFLRAYARPIFIGIAISGVILLLRFVYNAGYDSCKTGQLKAQIKHTERVLDAYEIIDRDSPDVYADADADIEWLLQHGIR